MEEILAKPVLVIDGSRFDDMDGFCREFSALLRNWTWRGNLNAFNDILGGGFGTPECGFILRWTNSARSRWVLPLFDAIVEIIEIHGPEGEEAGDGIDLELL